MIVCAPVSTRNLFIGASRNDKFDSSFLRSQRERSVTRMSRFSKPPRPNTKCDVHDDCRVALDGGPQAPIRLLCLHGKGGNAKNFKTGTAFLESEPLEMTYATAPHLVDPPKGFAWWVLPPGTRSYNAPKFQGAEESLELVKQLWERDGPFDGIMGFSQGAMLAAVVVAKALSDEDYSVRPRFGIFYGAAFPLPFAPLFEESREECYDSIPTLHVMGKTDQINPPQQGNKLANYFPEAKILWHEGAHTVPSDSESIEAVVDFCKNACGN